MGLQKSVYNALQGILREVDTQIVRGTGRDFGPTLDSPVTLYKFLKGGPFISPTHRSWAIAIDKCPISLSDPRVSISAGNRRFLSQVIL